MIQKLLVPVLFSRAAFLWVWYLFRKPGVDKAVFSAESAVLLNESPVRLYWDCAGSYLVHLKHGGWYRGKGSALVFPVKGLQQYELTVYGPDKRIMRTSVKRIDVDLTRGCQKAEFRKLNITHHLLLKKSALVVTHPRLSGTLSDKALAFSNSFFQPAAYESNLLFHA